MILETSKIYSIFGTISGDPKGASHCSLETYLVPSSVHFTWKFECAIFKGSWHRWCKTYKNGENSGYSYFNFSKKL